ncbi:MAG TPA: NTP transferase domain-containing protein [Bryobacteraceae bacterium]|nr:NTP transferase domain-containing protein [Bryobacteraceae bacterium]
MHCAILAGGLGTRMRQYAATVPKNLLPVRGVPFAARQLSALSAAGVTGVTYCIGHMGDQIRAFVGDGSRWGLSVNYADEGTDLQGTAGALRVAVNAGLVPEQFLLLYGDSWLPIDYAAVWHVFLSSGCPALMTVFRNEGLWDTSNVLLEDGRIVVYDKQRHDPRSSGMRHIDYGLSVLTAAVVRELVPSSGKADLADVFHRLSLSGQLASYEASERFYEIGSPAGLADLEASLAATELQKEAAATPR